MSIWSPHPRYFDAKGLVALRGEAPLAQKVLERDARGYRDHPQFDRFKAAANPLADVAAPQTHPLFSVLPGPIEDWEIR